MSAVVDTLVVDEPPEGDDLVVRYSLKDRPQSAAADLVLNATGRVPYSQGLGLDEAGLEELSLEALAWLWQVLIDDPVVARDAFAALSVEERNWSGADLEAASAACVNHLDYASIMARAKEKLA